MQYVPHDLDVCLQYLTEEQPKHFPMAKDR